MSNNIQKDDQIIDDQKTMQHLVFNIDEGIFGIDIVIVREIKGWIEPTPIPNAPQHLLGVMNLRGTIIPVIDLQVLLAKKINPDKKITSKNAIIVISIKDKIVGILVDSVSDIINSKEQDVQVMENQEKTDFEKNINGLITVNDKMLILLNIENLLSKTLNILSESNNGVSNV